MDWSDIACIVFIATTINHLGLISAIEERIKVRLLVVDCPKCLSHWLTFAYMIWHEDVITTLAVSLLAAYAALWLELIEGFIDRLYLLLYGKIYSSKDNTATADA